MLVLYAVRWIKPLVTAAHSFSMTNDLNPHMKDWEPKQKLI